MHPDPKRRRLLLAGPARAARLLKRARPTGRRRTVLMLGLVLGDHEAGLAASLRREGYALERFTGPVGEQAQLGRRIADKRTELEAFRERHDIASMEREENETLSRLRAMGRLRLHNRMVSPCRKASR
jgi:hypothetical protein